MENREEDRFKMYQAVLKFLAGLGLELQTVPLIKKHFNTLTGIVAAIGDAEKNQTQSTVEMTRDRETMKKNAAGNGEALRQQVLAVSEDAQVRGNLKRPVSELLAGNEKDFLAYLKLIGEAVDGLTA